jgi:hypothetical protein
MKRHAFRRGLLAAAVYVVVILSLVLVQFSRNTGFTFNVGSIAVTGKYERGADGAGDGAERSLAGPVAVFFGGMEFRLAESDGLAAVRDGRSQPAKPVSLSPVEGGVAVRLSDKSELRFVTLFVGGEETLRATASFARGTAELRVPYRPMRSSRVAELGNGKSAVVFGGDSFAFSSAVVDAEKRDRKSVV